MELIGAMFKVIVCMVLGFFLNKIKILSEQSNKTISAFIVNVTFPCTMFAAIAAMESSDKASVYMLLLIGAAVYVFLAIGAFITTKLIRLGKSCEGVLQNLLVFGNVSFLGIPLVQALYGDLGVFYMAVLCVHSNVFTFTYGLYLITKDVSGSYKFNPKNLLSPGLISIVLALIIYLCGISLPGLIIEPIEFIGQITSPLAMITIGSMIATYSLKELFSNPKYYILSAVKLLIFPAVVYLVLRLTIGESLITNIVTIYVAMPTANTVNMLVLNYGGDSKTAACVTGLMTILCIATIPAIYLLLGKL